jgi:hypothetical protein
MPHDRAQFPTWNDTLQSAVCVYTATTRIIFGKFLPTVIKQSHGAKSGSKNKKVGQSVKIRSALVEAREERGKEARPLSALSGAINRYQLPFSRGSRCAPSRQLRLRLRLPPPARHSTTLPDRLPELSVKQSRVNPGS